MHPRLSAYLSRLLIDRKDGHRRRALAYWREIQAFDQLLDNERVRHQSAELSELLRYAQTHVPAYRGLLGDRRIVEENAHKLLSGLPILTKHDLQTRRHELTADNCTDSREDATGGSSGQPTVFLTDGARRLAGEAATFWSNGLAGWEYGERVAMLWGADEEKEEQGKRKEERREGGREVVRLRQGYGEIFASPREVRCRLRKWIENVRWYNAFDMGENRMRDFHRQMTCFAPHLLVAYAGSLFEYARFLERNNITPTYPLKSIVSSAEVLTSAMREMVERVFAKPIFDRYGNREFAPIAAECEAHDGLHINEHNMLVEIDSPDPGNVPGEIIVTYFNNFAQLFIRYNTGDMATINRKPCSCGRTTARLKSIEGRSSDTITTADGRMIHGEYFTHLMYGCEGVRAFQFVQERLDSYVLRVECEAEITGISEDKWLAEIRKKVGSEADARVETVEHIPVLSSGKRKFTVSLLSE